MKKLLSIAAFACTLFALSACNKDVANAVNPDPNDTNDVHNPVGLGGLLSPKPMVSYMESDGWHELEYIRGYLRHQTYYPDGVYDFRFVIKSFPFGKVMSTVEISGMVKVIDGHLVQVEPWNFLCELNPNFMGSYEAFPRTGFLGNNILIEEHLLGPATLSLEFDKKYWFGFSPPLYLHFKDIPIEVIH